MSIFQNKKSFKLASVAAAISLLSACSDSSSSSPEENKIYQGTFIDSPVAGLNYQCGELTGITGVEGKFDYQLGDLCTFSIGEFSLGSITDMSAEKSIISPFDVAENTEQAIKIASLLQTIDADGNPENGIDIRTFDSSALTTAILSVEGEDFYQAIFDVTGFDAVKLDDARKHMEASLSLAKGYHSKAVEQVITEIEAVGDLEQLDVQSFLANIHAILDAGDDSNNNDIQSLKALISIYEILNDPRVQARMDVTNNSSNYTEMLPQLIDASMNASALILKDAKGTTEDISGLFFEMSTRLVAASDTLAISFVDPNYVARYGENSHFSLTAEDVYIIQLTALSTASLLSYFSAYNYGSDAYYLPQSIEQQMDVINIIHTATLAEPLKDQIRQTITAKSAFTESGIHPEAQYLDENFGRLHTDEKYLTLAKTSLIKAIETGKISFA